MTELIHFTWGQSSLGEFLAAVSDAGLVAFGFADRGGPALDALRESLPEAELAEDEAGLADIAARLAALADYPESDPGIAPDPRGSDYQKRVWSLLRRVPAGATTSYGALAAELGTRDARDVTEAIAANPIAILIPCHRVVKKDGSISGYRWGVRRKRALLDRESRAAPFRLA